MRPQPQQQQLPVQELQDCYSQANDVLQLQQQIVPVTKQQPQQPASSTSSQATGQQEGSFDPRAMEQQHADGPAWAVSLQHPARRHHMQQCQAYLAVLQGCLTALGVTQQQANWTGPTGLWCDLVVQIPSAVTGNSASKPAAGSSSSGSSVAKQPVAAAGSGQVHEAGGCGCSPSFLAFQILGPADLCAGRLR